MRHCPRCASELLDRHVDGVARKACGTPECGFICWDNPLPVVAASVEYEGWIVLARNAPWPHGMFSLVTGFLEKAESPEQAVVRE